MKKFCMVMMAVGIIEMVVSLFTGSGWLFFTGSTLFISNIMVLNFIYLNEIKKDLNKIIKEQKNTELMIMTYIKFYFKNESDRNSDRNSR